MNEQWREVERGRGAAAGEGLQQASDAALLGVERWVQERLETLYGQAEDAVACFQAQLAEAARGRHPSAIGKIGVRVRRQSSAAATPGSFTIDWVTFRYANTQAGRKCHTTYIPRGDGDRYPASAYRGSARLWQRPVIAQAEDVFAGIRRQARLVAGVRTQLRAALRAQAEEARRGDGSDPPPGVRT